LLFAMSTVKAVGFCTDWLARSKPSLDAALRPIHALGKPAISWTQEGLRIRAELDENTYDAGIKVSDEELADMSIERDAFHGEWNYRIKSRRTQRQP